MVLTIAACASSARSNPRNEEFAGLGRVGASSSLPAGVYAPVAGGDLVAVQERGVLLHAMERALRLGYEQGAYAVGMTDDHVVLPLVDVDPGGRSAQVVFVRWRRDRAHTSEPLEPQAAQRWLLVSVLLEPDRVLDKELLAGTVTENSAEYHRVAALLAAAEALQAETPGETFHLHPVSELISTGSKRIPTAVATRVYALAARSGGPDAEVLVDEPGRRRAPDVLATEVVHEGGPSDTAVITVRGSQPAPATVARAMLRGLPGSVDVQASSGCWSVDSRTGRVSPPSAASRAEVGDSARRCGLP